MCEAWSQMWCLGLRETSHYRCMKYSNVSYGPLITSFLLVVEGGVGEEEGGNYPNWEMLQMLK